MGMDPARVIEKSNVIRIIATQLENNRRKTYTSSFKLPRSYGNHITMNICMKNKKKVSLHSKRWYPHCWYPKFWNNRTMYETFWNKQKPVFSHLIDVSRPIVHFRCGDVPIGLSDKHKSQYALPCVRDIQRLMDYANVTRAWMIVGGHGGHERECDAFARQYARELHDVTLLDRASVETDFMWLKSAPKVVTVVLSSFAFVSRLGKLDTLFMPNTKKGITTTAWAPLNFEAC